MLKCLQRCSARFERSIKSCDFWENHHAMSRKGLQLPHELEHVCLLGCSAVLLLRTVNHIHMKVFLHIQTRKSAVRFFMILEWRVLLQSHGVQRSFVLFCVFKTNFPIDINSQTTTMVIYYTFDWAQSSVLQTTPWISLIQNLLAKNLFRQQ